MSSTGVASLALAEASAESLGELFSRDPLSYQQQDLDRIIKALRAEREKWKAGELIATSKGPKAPKAPKAPPVVITDLDELGI
jgi:hypothetical protein